MGSTPWNKYKTPEVVSEGGPWAKYGQMSPREAVDALPTFLTRTAEEKAEDQHTKGQRYAAEMFGGLDDQNIRRAATYGDNFLNAATIGNAEGVNSLLDKIGVGGVSMNAPTAEDAKQRTRAFRGELRSENPMSAIAGEITGSLAPGTVAWKGLSTAGKAVPGAAQLANLIAKSGRVPNWLARVAGSSALFTADAGLYGATVGASNEAAMTGEDPTLTKRAQTGIDYAKANIGDMADASGVEIPSWARGIPVAMVLPAAGSVAERSIKGISSGGKTITPDRVAAEVLENVGRTPSPNSTAGAMAEVIPGERITSGTVKTFRFVENALRNGLKDAGLAPAEITSRVTRGFNSIKQSLPALADGRTTLAQLIEREFADAGPQVSENLRLFLLRVGLDDPAVTRGIIQEMRSGQVEDFRNAVNENLGSQRQYDLEQSLKQGLQKIGETYDQILNKAKGQGNNSPLADSLREQIRDSRFKFELTEEASKRGWKDVDTFIQQDPWSAAHKLKSKLLTEARAAKASGNYEKYQEPAIYLREMLNELPGYQRLSEMYAKEASVLDTLGFKNTLPNGQQVTVEGFGPKLRKAGRSETETLRMADDFAGMPQRQQQAAATSTGQVLKDQLRTARPGGTDLQGQDVMGLRLTDLQNEGMMSTNPEIPGALPMVFGEAGENISKRVDDIVNSRKFLADIDPQTGSNTVNKANAQMGGDAVVTSGLPRTMTSGYTQSGLIDATMFASGLPPVATMLTKGIPALGRVLGPGRQTRAEIAKTLLQRPARRGPPPSPPEALPQLTGRNRPRKWRNDPKWSDPNLTNPQLPMKDEIITNGAGGPVTGAILGGTIASDYNDDGKVTWEERLLMAGLGAGLGAKMGGGGGGGRGVAKRAPQRTTNAFTTTGGNEIAVTSGRLKNGDIFVDFTANGSQYGRGGGAANSLGETNEVLRGVGQEVRRILTDEKPQRLVIGAHTDQQARIYRNLIERSDLQGYQLTREMSQGGPLLVLSRGEPPASSGGILGNQRGNIVIDGRPMRRQDAMREARQAGGGSFPTQQAAPPQPPSALPQRGSGVMESPLLPLLGLGAGGVAVGVAADRLNNPNAATDLPKKGDSSFVSDIMANANTAMDDITMRREQGLPKTPGLKPDLNDNIQASAQAASDQARRAELQRRRQVWEVLRARGDGLEWNQAHEKRAMDLKIKPDEARMGIVAKRLAYSPEMPIEQLESAPIEILVNGQWMPESALESAR